MLRLKLHSGGTLVERPDGLSYVGGETRLFPIYENDTFLEVKERLEAEYGPCTLAYEFELELITVRSDVDLKMWRCAVEELRAESTSPGRNFVRAFLSKPSPPPELGFEGPMQLSQLDTSKREVIEAEVAALQNAIPAQPPAVPYAVLTQDPSLCDSEDQSVKELTDFLELLKDLKAAERALRSPKTPTTPQPDSPQSASPGREVTGAVTQACDGSSSSSEDEALERAGVAPAAMLFRAGSFSAERESWEIPFSELTLHECLGSGSFGRVHRATWRGTVVACKLLNNTKLQAAQFHEFRHEVGVLSEIRHPNAVLFMGACTASDSLALITEYVPHGDLFRLLHSHLPLSFDARLGIAVDVAQCLCFLHHCNPPILHLDLKTSNILVRESFCGGWIAKVADFGLSKHKTHAYIAGSKGMRGTIPFMAPEVMKKEHFNEKADVFSFGRLLWSIYKRREPFHGMQRQDMIAAVLDGCEFTLDDACPAFYASLVRECCMPQPDARPTFDQVLSRLRDEC